MGYKIFENRVNRNKSESGVRVLPFSDFSCPQLYECRKIQNIEYPI